MTARVRRVSCGARSARLATATSMWTDMDFLSSFHFFVMYTDFIHLPYFLHFLLQTYGFTSFLVAAATYIPAARAPFLRRHTSCLGPSARSIMRNLVKKIILTQRLCQLSLWLTCDHGVGMFFFDRTESDCHHRAKLRPLCALRLISP